MSYKKRSKPRLIISSYDNIRNPYYKGGGARVLDELAQRLSNTHKITIITARHPMSRDFTNGNVRYKHIGPRRFGPQIGQLLFHFTLPYYVLHSKFDLWIESFTPPFSTTCLQLFTKKPVIGLAHMLASQDMWRKYKLPFHILENLGLKTYKFFITLSPNESAKIRNQNKIAAIFTIPNGISPTHPQQGLYTRKNNPYIFFIGRIEYNQKGLDLLIEGYRSIAEKTNVKLVIAGTGKKRDMRALRAAIKKAGLEDRVDMVGEVAGAQKEKLFRESIAIVQSSRYETFSVVALEALTYGKPLIAFDIEGFKWLPEQCIMRAPAFDARALGDLMFKVVSDVRTRRQLSYAGKRYAKRFAWPKVTQQYRSAISHVMRVTV